MKIKAATVIAANKTAEEEGFKANENVYEKVKPELQFQFRYILNLDIENILVNGLCFRNFNRNISQICRGFLKSLLHLRNQLIYLARWAGLLDTVIKNLKTQLGNL